jgi:hypothetical protein
MQETTSATHPPRTAWKASEIGVSRNGRMGKAPDAPTLVAGADCMSWWRAQGRLT